MSKSKPVIAIIDVGKTNKKIFLFDEDYKIVYERSARFFETEDEDGFPCENVESIRLALFDSLRDVFRRKEFNVKALNFTTYGASFVYIDEEGNTIAPLYNYLKPYPEELQKKFYDTYGGEEKFSNQTASPVLGNLNSGMQLYRIKYEKPELFKRIKYALHLPQYLSYLITGKVYSDITSIGCHTNLWDFKKNDYHEWVGKEGILEKLAPITSFDTVLPAVFPGSKYPVGIGLHDSSAALIPYQVNFHEPFVLISTGTWCISLNPFNQQPLTVEELKQDCLCYMHYEGKPVKASRLFAGQHYEEQVNRIADFFHKDTVRYRTIKYDHDIITTLQNNSSLNNIDVKTSLTKNCFEYRDLSKFSNDVEAYHQLMLDIIAQQYISTKLILHSTNVRRIFVDGGFSKNEVYMNLLASVFTGVEVYAASMAQATALGAALAINRSWNKNPAPADIIALKYYSGTHDILL
jgi:Sugar (pentulose and hexulose) kinases